MGDKFDSFSFGIQITLKLGIWLSFGPRVILHYGGMFLKSVFCGVLTNTPVSPLHFFSFVSNRTITSNQAKDLTSHSRP